MSAPTSAIYREATATHGREVIGHVGVGGCENPACLAAMRDERPFHATPMGFAVTLDDYHFATREEAVRAIERAMIGVPGRRLDVGVGEDHAWRAGTYDDAGYTADVQRARFDGYDWA